jgi:hypothetical protein
MASDIHSVHYTDATFAGSTFTTTAAGSISSTNNSTYSLADYGDDLESRIVSCGIRVRYIGKELDRSGQTVALETQHHHSIINLSMTDMQSRDKAVSMPVDREWKACTWQPVKPAEYDYSDNPYPGNNSTHHLGIMFTGEPGSQFAFEYVVKGELIGVLARNKSATPAYPETARVIAALGNLRSADWQPYLNGAITSAAFLNKAYNALYRNSQQRLMTYY